MAVDLSLAKVGQRLIQRDGGMTTFEGRRGIDKSFPFVCDGLTYTKNGKYTLGPSHDWDIVDTEPPKVDELCCELGVPWSDLPMCV